LPGVAERPLGQSGSGKNARVAAALRGSQKPEQVVRTILPSSLRACATSRTTLHATRALAIAGFVELENGR
jgi:hypothetical protein